MPMASLWCFFCQLCKYFTPCSSVSIVNIEQVIAGCSWLQMVSSGQMKSRFTQKCRKNYDDCTICNTYDKKNYTVHIKVLTLTLDSGVILENVRKVIEFNGEA